MSFRKKIQDPSELGALDSWRFVPPRETTQLQLDANSSTAEQLRLWERELTRLQSPCGCEEGARGLLVGVVGYLLYLVLRPGGWGNPGWRELWIGCGVVFVTASVGKVLGIVMGRRKLRRLIRQVRAEWTPPRPPEHNSEVTLPRTMRQSRPCCG